MTEKSRFFLKNHQKTFRTSLARLFVVFLPILSSCTVMKAPPVMQTDQTPPNAEIQTDDAFLNMIERDSTRYFLESICPESGLVTEDGQNTLMGSNGYGLTACCIAAERGWIPRDIAADRVLAMLKTFRFRADTFHGVFGWVMDAETARHHVFGKTYDLVETSYICAGAILCRQYFNRDTDKERLIRTLATQIYERTEWDFFMQGGGRPNTLAWVYNAEQQRFDDLRIMGYNECMITYLLALASPTHPTPPESWDGWASSYRWESAYGYEYFYCPSLFPYQYSLVWLDLRNLQDRYTREKGITYFENARRAALAHKAYAEQNPNHFPEYGPLWGLTDCACPLHPSGFGEHGLGWDVHGPALDDGTIGITAAGGCIAFTPEESIAFLRYLYDHYATEMYDAYGFRNGMNLQLGWFDPGHEPLNKGAFLSLIENYRTGFCWKLFMADPDVQRGLHRAGFTPINSP